jgi:hypothetical protein
MAESFGTSGGCSPARFVSQDVAIEDEVGMRNEQLLRTRLLVNARLVNSEHEHENRTRKSKNRS